MIVQGKQSRFVFDKKEKGEKKKERKERKEKRKRKTECMKSSVDKLTLFEIQFCNCSPKKEL